MKRPTEAYPAPWPHRGKRWGGSSITRGSATWTEPISQTRPRSFPLKIDDHIQLSLILYAVVQFQIHPGRARPSSLDGTRDHIAITINAKKKFGRVADERVVAEVEIGTIARGALIGGDVQRWSRDLQPSRR